MDYYTQRFKFIITTELTVEQKKEFLEQLILKLDEYDDRVFRKKFIIKIQNVLDILDKII